MSRLRSCLDGITGADVTGDGIVMFGPRGNGKTTLLNELKDVALRDGVTVRHLTAEDLSKGSSALCYALFAGVVEATRPGWWARAAWRSNAGLWNHGKW